MSVENQVHELQELLTSLTGVIEHIMEIDGRFEMVHELNSQLQDEVNLLIDD